MMKASIFLVSLLGFIVAAPAAYGAGEVKFIWDDTNIGCTCMSPSMELIDGALNVRCEGTAPTELADLCSDGGGGGGPYSLTVTKSGNGTVNSDPIGIACGDGCNHSYPQGTTVNLHVQAESGYRFSGWSGSCVGTEMPCALNMTADRSVHATFVQVVSGSDFGQQEDGKWVTEAQELAGQVEQTLYIPSIATYHTIVYSGYNTETIYPGCAGKLISGQQEWRACKTGSLEAGITYVQRLPVVDELPENRVEISTAISGDRHNNYDYSISSYPGDLDPDQAACKDKSSNGKTFYFQSWACSEPLQDLGNGKIKMYYLNFKAAGGNADRCNKSLDCRNYVRAWPSW